MDTTSWFEFLLASFVVVVIPGTGVIYTVGNGLKSQRASGLWAAIGCTIGIVPHLLASALGLAAIMHGSALVFQSIRSVGAVYLIFVAWQMWKSADATTIAGPLNDSRESAARIVTRGVLLNLLNPRLTLFFIAFIPQFVPQTQAEALGPLLVLSAVFMLMTLIVFTGYALLAHQFRELLLRSRAALVWSQRALAALLVVLAIRLGVPDNSV